MLLGWPGTRRIKEKAGLSASPDEKVIYSIHGGGWVVGSAHPSWMTGYFAKKMLQHVQEYTSVFQIEYRLSPLSSTAHSGRAFPAAIIDSVMGYNYLVNELGFKPSNILLVGESAGASIAFALMRYCVTESIPALPPPHAFFLNSPACDWGNTHTGVNSSMARNYNSDFIGPVVDTCYAINAYLGTLPRFEGFTSPWISPASLTLDKSAGHFKGFPPTLIISGSREILLDSIHTLRKYMADEMGAENVSYIEVADGTHVIMSCDFFDRENTQAYKEFARWLKTIDDYR